MAKIKHFFGGAAAEPTTQPGKQESTPAPETKAEKLTITVPETVKPAASYLAAGTSFEGTLRCEGDVEIAGSFKGDVTATGTIRLCSDIQSSISAESLTLSDCTLTGDVVTRGAVSISGGSCINGNVTASELQCAGRITGDLKITGNTSLASTAQIHGSIATGTMDMEKGAAIHGGLEIRSGDAEKAAKPSKK